MRYFLSSIVIFLFFSKVVLANMQDPTSTINDNSDIDNMNSRVSKR